MGEITWYDVFLENLQEKYPKKTQLIEELMNLLCIEREAAYRRLRKEVIFPISEIAIIANAWQISLDEIVGINSGKVPFQLQPMNYLDPSKKEMCNFQKEIKKLAYIVTTQDAEYMEVGNKLPRPLCMGLTTLYRFMIFNWAYLYNNDEKYKKFSDIIIYEKLNREFETYSKVVKYVSHSNFILDKMVFEHLVHKIKYFHSILLVTDEEKKQLKEELNNLLDYLLIVANKGCYPETQKKVNIYISELAINTNYSYYYTESIKTCRVHAFGKHDICSFDSEMISDFINWMNLKKRASIQISEVNEKRRIEFFVKQKQLINSL